jgi:hypothetical protein
MPAMSHTTTSALWALLFAAYIFLGGIAIGWARGTSLVLAVAAGFTIFLFVRAYGEETPRG